MVNAECEGGGDGFYRQVVAQVRGNAQAVKRGNFGGKEEMSFSIAGFAMNAIQKRGARSETGASQTVPGRVNLSASNPG